MKIEEAIAKNWISAIDSDDFDNAQQILTFSLLGAVPTEGVLEHIDEPYVGFFQKQLRIAQRSLSGRTPSTLSYAVH